MFSDIRFSVGALRIQHTKQQHRLMKLQTRTERNLGSITTLIPAWTGTLTEITADFLSTSSSRFYCYCHTLLTAKYVEMYSTSKCHSTFI
jgi:hypothetical protein